VITEGFVVSFSGFGIGTMYDWCQQDGKLPVIQILCRVLRRVFRASDGRISSGPTTVSLAFDKESSSSSTEQCCIFLCDKDYLPRHKVGVMDVGNGAWYCSSTQYLSV